MIFAVVVDEIGATGEVGAREGGCAGRLRRGRADEQHEGDRRGGDAANGQHIYGIAWGDAGPMILIIQRGLDGLIFFVGARRALCMQMWRDYEYRITSCIKGAGGRLSSKLIVQTAHETAHKVDECTRLYSVLYQLSAGRTIHYTTERQDTPARCDRVARVAR